MDFLSMAVSIFEFLVLGLLPLVSVAMVVIYIVKIGDAGRNSVGNFMKKAFHHKK